MKNVGKLREPLSFYDLFIFPLYNQTGAQANTPSKLLYIGIIERIERMSQRFYFIAVKISFVGLMIPPLLSSYTNYFLYDLKEASFQLPYDGWYE